MFGKPKDSWDLKKPCCVSSRNKAFYFVMDTYQGKGMAGSQQIKLRDYKSRRADVISLITKMVVQFFNIIVDKYTTAHYFLAVFAFTTVNKLAVYFS